MTRLETAFERFALPLFGANLVALPRRSAQSPAKPQPRPTRHRTIWISDIHLGTRGCKAEMLLDFLRHNDSDMLYLVGDIVDGWRLRKGWYWPDAHSEVVRRVLKMAHRGTRVV